MIGARDGWKWQEPGCSKSFQDGYMVHAAHYPEHHSKDDPLYDSPEGGRILCIQHHIEDHVNGTSLGRSSDDWALQKLESVPHRTRWWLNSRKNRGQ